MEKIIFVIIAIVVILTIIYIIIKNKKITNYKFQINNKKKEYNLNKYKKYSIDQMVNDEYFNATQFHYDYVDVIDAFNDIAPNNKQLFNINNVPCITTKNVDVEIVEEIVNNFIEELKENIVNNIYVVRENTLSWQSSLPRQKYTDGFEKVQKGLGLPEKLYNDNVLKTKIYLIEFSDIVKYETEIEVKYTTYVLIGRDKSKDKIFIKVSFMYDKKQPKSIIIENINILGYTSKNGTNNMYADVNNYYNFDSLDDNNMLNSEDIMKELEYKYKIREKLMQEQVDNMHPDDKYTHMNIDPYQYDSYKEIQTIYEDVYGEKYFE
jgi:hypothetical protein